ncbi:hypothetical protein BDW72DRAFT_187925 [Aspergillus terricola var. indicus]
MTLLPTRHLHSLHLIEKLLKWNWYEEALLHQMAFLHHAFNEHHVHSRKRCLNLVQELWRQEHAGKVYQAKVKK